ncbi:MAG TPA: response regulator transcription factor [Bryobacteraceae bacterium]|nr:response regulator transcription factor [Bryobacteraceae bacterium]
MQPTNRLIRVYTDRELLAFALPSIAGEAFHYDLIRTDRGAEPTPAPGAEVPSALIVDCRAGIFELIRKLSVSYWRVPIVVWQRTRANEPSLNALDWGAAGVLHDNSSSQDVIACLDSVTKGCAWIPDSVAQAASRSRRCHLSRREGQLLSLVVQGLRNKEIAHALRITEGTVKVYFSRLFQKLGVSDRYELALLGLRHCVPDAILPNRETSRTTEYEPLNSIYVNRTLGFESTFAANSNVPSNIPRM